jgi:hypothetical protein
MSRRGSARARRVAVTEELGALDGPSYAGAFEVAVDATDVRSPAQWARAVFEGAPRLVRGFVVVGWQSVLGLRLARPTAPDHVLGWTIATVAADAILLEAHAPRLTAHKVLRVEASRVVLTTFVRYDRRGAHLLWSAVAPVHHRTEPYLLGHAASHPPPRPADPPPPTQI